MCDYSNHLPVSLQILVFKLCLCEHVLFFFLIGYMFKHLRYIIFFSPYSEILFLKM